MSAHTAGPWEWRGDKLIAVGDSTTVIDFAPYDGMWFSGFDDVEAANRGIIAAAPDLLHLLTQMRDYMSDIPESAVGGDDYAVSLCRKAGVAIAKATGKS